MKVLFDTNALIALVVSQHPNHLLMNKTFLQLQEDSNEFFISTHSLAEAFRTLTWGHAYLKFSSKQAHQIITKSILPLYSVIDLDQSDYLEVLGKMNQLRLTGAIIYDALIAQAASKVKADYIVTFNTKDFNRILPGNGLKLLIPGSNSLN